jgi:hypothetical protein
MAKFQMKELVLNGDRQTARLANATTAANGFNDNDIDKPIKLVADSRYDLCAVGDVIEAFAKSVEAAIQDNFVIGTYQAGGRKEVMFDGLQATPGVGAIAVGDIVVTGTTVARNTVLPGAPKVCKATNQPGAVPADLTAAGQQAKNAMFAWRVVSLGSVGTGAVGTVGVIERV